MSASPDRIERVAGEVLNALVENGMVAGLDSYADDPISRYREVHRVIAGTLRYREVHRVIAGTLRSELGDIP